MMFFFKCKRSSFSGVSKQLCVTTRMSLLHKHISKTHSTIIVKCLYFLRKMFGSRSWLQNIECSNIFLWYPCYL